MHKMSPKQHDNTRKQRRQHTTLLPLEIPVSVLAALTVLLTLPPLNLPIWATFISWAGTLLLGKRGGEGIRKMWPPLILGTIWGILSTLFLSMIIPLVHAEGDQLLVTMITMGVVAVAAATLLILSRIPLLSVTPGAFLGFAVVDASVADGLGSLHTLLMIWLSASLMLLLGPVLAWAAGKLAFPRAVSTSQTLPEAAFFPDADTAPLPVVSRFPRAASVSPKQHLTADEVLIALHGPRWSASEDAAMAYFGYAPKLLSYTSCADVFASVSKGPADFGIVPFEYSIRGPVAETYDLLCQHDLFVVGEITYPLMLTPFDETCMRFLIVSREPDGREIEWATAKTLLALTLKEQRDALSRCLSVFAAHGVSVLHIESRPLRRLGSFVYFIEVTGSRTDPTIRNVLADVATYTLVTKVLGSFPRNSATIEELQTEVRITAVRPQKTSTEQGQSTIPVPAFTVANRQTLPTIPPFARRSFANTMQEERARKT